MDLDSNLPTTDVTRSAEDRELRFPSPPLVRPLVSLAALIVDEGPLTPLDALGIARALADELRPLHAQRLAHGELEPGAVLVARTGTAAAAWSVRLGAPPGMLGSEGDPGASVRPVSMSVSRNPAWSAPERIYAPGPAMPAADVWSFGLVVFHALSGQSYWAEARTDAEPTASLLREVLGDPLIAASLRAAELGMILPISFDRWFASCVARDPGARFADVSQAAGELACALELADSNAADSTGF